MQVVGNALVIGSQFVSNKRKLMDSGIKLKVIFPERCICKDPSMGRWRYGMAVSIELVCPVMGIVCIEPNYAFLSQSFSSAGKK